MIGAAAISRDDFNRRIWAVVDQIPWGRVCSYGRVADLAGYPGYARQVAAALRASPADRSLPWHRVITASGRLGLPPDSAAYAIQIERLRAEGVRVERGRVDIRVYLWQSDLDALLWRFDSESAMR